MCIRDSCNVADGFPVLDHFLTAGEISQRDLVPEGDVLQQLVGPAPDLHRSALLVVTQRYRHIVPRVNLNKGFLQMCIRDSDYDENDNEIHTRERKVVLARTQRGKEKKLNYTSISAMRPTGCSFWMNLSLSLIHI